LDEFGFGRNGTSEPRFRSIYKELVEEGMPVEASDNGFPLLGRIGAALVGAAIVCPALTLPAVLAFGGLIVVAKQLRAGAEPQHPAEAEPVERQPRTGGDPDTTEDSFPASDPPSWTPVTGTGTRH
jgi:hypothetical protein